MQSALQGIRSDVAAIAVHGNQMMPVKAPALLLMRATAVAGNFDFRNISEKVPQTSLR